MAFAEAHAAGMLVGGRYQLVELAGQGGMADVWRANLVGAQGFHRPVALKRIRKHLVHRPEHRAMFVQEARLTAQLDHPNIVQVHDFGEDEWGLYLAMEWVEGITLRQLIELRASLGQFSSPSLIAAIGIETLAALSAAHGNEVLDASGRRVAAPIIHRDVSPSNVLLSERGVVKLADFGLARAASRAGTGGGHTPVGVVKGKVAYLAPEVLRGGLATAQSDVYSCAVVLWEAMCGRRMYLGCDDYEVAIARARGAVAPAISTLRPDVPRGLGEAIDRGLARDPRDRYPTAIAFAWELSDVLRTIPERTDRTVLTREVQALADLRRQRQLDGPPSHTLVDPPAVTTPSDGVAWPEVALAPTGGTDGPPSSLPPASENSGALAIPLVTPAGRTKAM